MDYFCWYASRTHRKIPPPFPFRSKLKGAWQPSIKNWLSGKLSSSFVSDIINVSTEPLLSSLSISNLFLNEFAFSCPNISLLKLLMQIPFNNCFASGLETLEIHSPSPLDSYIQSCWVKLNRFLVSIELLTSCI